MFTDGTRNWGKAPQPEVEQPPAPTACPFCRSSRITTASEKVDASTYWRCEACGELWNLGRVRPSSRSRYERP
jgi:ribosomal protein L37AE/L43A